MIGGEWNRRLQGVREFVSMLMREAAGGLFGIETGEREVCERFKEGVASEIGRMV